MLLAYRPTVYGYSVDQVTSFQRPSTSLTVNPGRGLTWSLTGAGISLHGNWRIKYRVVFPVSNSGSFDASVSGASVSVSVTLGASADGEPTIRTSGCTCHIDRVHIHLHGGASWLYDLFMGSVERRLRDNLQSKICDAAQTAVNTDVAGELATMPVRTPLGGRKDWVLDYRLVAGPNFAAGYLDSFHKGEFFNAGDETEAPFQPAPLPSPPSADRMATFWGSSYVLNTAGYGFIFAAACSAFSFQRSYLRRLTVRQIDWRSYDRPELNWEIMQVQ